MGATRQNIKIFTEDEIKRITSDYSTLIGRGGYGEVYKGFLDDDHDLVAVKRYIRADLREEFMEEVSIHSQMNHKNVVKLIGYCIGESTLIMVTEYISKGNLDDKLHRSGISIPLDTRLGIAIGCAEALRYMHSMHLSSDSLVCHGDIKPANILLDDNLTAKVSDFGLSKSLFGGITRYTINVKGSLDYMDPMYLRERRLTPKSDVYSFGVVLLELIARKRVKQGDLNLIGAFSKASAKGKQLRELFDEHIANESNMKILEEIEKLATECLTLDVAKRPQMIDVAERLRMLRKVQKGVLEKPARRFLWGAQNALQKDYNQGTSIFSSNSMLVHRKKRLGIQKRTYDYYEILKELNVRLFTKGEVNEVTQNYSYRLGGSWSYEVSKGTLEDNTLVAVKKYCQANEAQKYEFIKAAVILSQILHKNIAKLLGCCLEADTPILVYEYATKGNLYDVLHGEEEIPLELRMKIAIKTAKALEYLHSSGISLIRRGCFVPSNILLDDSFMPKIIPNCFSVYRCCATSTTNLIRYLSDEMNYMDLIYLNTGCLTVKSDVYSFGITLLELISRKTLIMYDNEYGRLVPEFIEAYETDNSGYALFDEDITAAEDIAALEGIGRLALKCISLEVDERPSMKEVAERLETLRRCWKKHTAKSTGDDISGTEGTKPDSPLGSEIDDSP